MITKMMDAADEERLSRLRENTVFAKLASSKKRKDSKAAQAEIEAGTGQQERIIAALRTLASEGVVKGRLERIFGTSESRCHGSRGT